MDNEPLSGKRSDEGIPGDSLHPNDILSDSSIEEIDLESLLQEESSAARSGRAAERQNAILDDGDIDLLSDPVEDTPPDLEQGNAAVSAGRVGGNEGYAFVETASGTAPGEGALEVLPASADRGEETAVLNRKGKSMEELEQSGSKKGGKKFGKGPKKLGKKDSNHGVEEASVVSGDASEMNAGKAGIRTSRKDAGKKDKREKAEAPEKARPAAAMRVRGSIAFVCSECYEEFLLPSNYSQEMVSCPECLHVGKRPDEDFLRTVNRHKAGERKSLTLAVAVGAVLFLLIVGLLWLASDSYIAAGKKPDENIVLGLLGGSGLLAAVFLWLVVRFEGNRWEVYF